LNAFGRKAQRFGMRDKRPSDGKGRFCTVLALIYAIDFLTREAEETPLERRTPLCIRSSRYQ
jgi:hypothetical protein